MIGGLEPCSFLDFPGRVSAVVFLQGCNLRCPYCHNPGLLEIGAPGLMGQAELLDFLAARRGRLDGVVLSGGEPTLAPELRPLIEAVRALGFKVKLDTNGTRPEVLAALLADQLVDYVAMDLKDEPAAYTRWLGLRDAPELLVRSLALLATAGVDHELRTTVVSPHHDEERLGRMARWAAGCRRWLLQPCRSASSPPFDPARDEAVAALARAVRERHGAPCWSRSEARRMPGVEAAGPLPGASIERAADLARE